jgi:hypothetical protein
MQHITTITIQVVSDDEQPGYHLGMKPIVCTHPKHVVPCSILQQLFNVDLPARLRNSGVKSAQLVNADDVASIATARAAMMKLLAKNPTVYGKNYNNGVLDAINCLPKS